MTAGGRTLARLDEIDFQWAEWLGCRLEQLREVGTHLCVSREIAVDRLLVLVRGGASILRVHTENAALGDRLARAQPPGATLRASEAHIALGDRSLGELDPQQILYSDDASFVPTAGPPARPLTEADTDLWQGLVDACSERDVKLSEIELGQPHVVGILDGERLAAASSYLRPGGPIADIGVLTRPDCRGRGLGRAVASTTCAHALAHDLIPQWWALRSNLGSLAIAAKLGFVHYAYWEGLRLRPEVA